jgi:hypothetical protein
LNDPEVDAARRLPEGLLATAIWVLPEADFDLHLFGKSLWNFLQPFKNFESGKWTI